LVFVGTAMLAAALGGCRDRVSERQPTEPVLPKAPDRSGATVSSYADIVKKVAGAVVTIRSERLVRAPRRFPFTSDPFFREFFGDRFGGRPEPQLQRGLGSGVIVTEDGYVLTNHHVIDGADEIQVETTGNRSYRAKVVGSDPPTDLAVLKIEGDALPMLHLGDSDQVHVGDVVLAIGNPLGIGQTVTAGIISAKERSTGMGDGSFQSFLQTDAPINRGNSGGALVNTAGDLIGINSQIVSETGGNIGIGFAIPSNMARQVSEQLIKSGNVRRGKLGVTIQTVTPEIAASLGLPNAKGVIVSSVETGGPADRAGIRQGDIITRINGTEVEDGNELRNRIAAMEPGSEVTVTLLRDGQEQQLSAKLVELAEGGGRAPAGPGGRQGDEEGRFGITVTPLTPELAAQLRVPRDAQGLVVIELDPTGPAAQAGIREGDLIQQVNRRAVRSVSDLRSALQGSAGRPALLLIRREASYYYVTIQTR
jgi:Do/DeqQ family serine protease